MLYTALLAPNCCIPFLSTRMKVSTQREMALIAMQSYSTTALTTGEKLYFLQLKGLLTTTAYQEHTCKQQAHAELQLISKVVLAVPSTVAPPS